MWNTDSTSVEELQARIFSRKVVLNDYVKDMFLQMPIEWIRPKEDLKSLKDVIDFCLLGKIDAKKYFTKLRDGVLNNERMNCIFYGGPGNGKTSLAYALAYIHQHVFLSKHKKKELSHTKRTNVTYASLSKSMKEMIDSFCKEGDSLEALNELSRDWYEGTIETKTITVDRDINDFYFGVADIGYNKIKIINGVEAKLLYKLELSDDYTLNEHPAYLECVNAPILIIDDLNTNCSENTREILKSIFRSRIGSTFITTNVRDYKLNMHFGASIDGFQYYEFKSESIRGSK